MVDFLVASFQISVLSYLDSRSIIRFLISSKSSIKITNNGLKYLANAMKINLIGVDNITDEGLKYLINVTEINIFDNKNITIKDLKYLPKSTKIIMSSCQIFRIYS